MVLTFWKTEWNVPVLPKIYSGNTWAQREQLQPGQQEEQSWQCWRSWELTQKEDCLSCCRSQRPRLAFGAAPHQCSESQIPGDSCQRIGLNVGQLAPAESLQTLAEGQRWADPWLLLQRCGELGSCSFHLPAWAGWGKAGRWESIQATVSSCPWACQGLLPSEQINVPVGQSYLVLHPFAGKVTSFWWSISHKDITTPKITGQSSFSFRLLILFYPNCDTEFLYVLFKNLDQRQWTASRLACSWPCTPAGCLHISGVTMKQLATKNQFISN